MRRNTLAVVISSLLLGAASAQAQEAAAPETQAPEVTQGTSTESTSSERTYGTSQDADASNQASAGTSSQGSADASTDGNAEVGEARSNVDEHATSGDYYPFSAGTVGDDPAYPKNTTAPPATSDGSNDRGDQWSAADSDGDGDISQDELSAVAPTLTAHFDAIDVDGNDKLTRDEFRTWQQSNQARMDADQGGQSDGTSSSAPATSNATESPNQDDATDDPSTRSTATETDAGQ